MPLSPDYTKQILIMALQLLRDHDAEIERLHAALQAIVNVLGERSAEFAGLHAKAMNDLRSRDSAYGTPVARSIENMLRIIQEA